MKPEMERVRKQIGLWGTHPRKIGHKPTGQIIADKCFLNEPEINSCMIFKSVQAYRLATHLDIKVVIFKTVEISTLLGLGIYFVPRSNSVIVNRLITAIRQLYFNPSDMTRRIWKLKKTDDDIVFERKKEDSSTPTNEPVSKVIPAEKLDEPKNVIGDNKTIEAPAKEDGPSKMCQPH